MEQLNVTTTNITTITTILTVCLKSEQNFGICSRITCTKYYGGLI